MKKLDFRTVIFIAGGIFILVSLAVAIAEYHGFTNYFNTWP